MHQDGPDENVQDQNLLNDEISQQLAGLQGQTASPASDNAATDTPTTNAPQADNYQRDGVDSPVAQPGAVVSPAPYEPPTELEPSPAATSTDAVQDMVTPDDSTSDSPVATPSVVPEPATDDSAQDESTTEPVAEDVDQATDEAVENAVAPLTAEENAEEVRAEAETPAVEEVDEPLGGVADDDSPATSAPVAGDGELAEIKKKAIEELSPMVDKLDLDPEKRYDVLMEMIQATDDRSLIPQAYEAAHQITDENLRAQALLEIINEVDYLVKPKE